MNNLTPEMQARLDKWKESVLPVKSGDILRERSPGNYVPRSRDYGYDMSEFDDHDVEELPKTRGYR